MCIHQKEQAEAQFEGALQELERHVRQQRSTTVAIVHVHAAFNNFQQRYQALQDENERLQQHVRALSPPSPASTVLHCIDDY